MAPGCHEKVDLEFLRWVWNFPRDSRPKVMRRIAEARAGKRVEVKVNVHSPGDKFNGNYMIVGARHVYRPGSDGKKAGYYRVTARVRRDAQRP